MTHEDPGPGVLPSLPRNNDGPTFSEPWQAQSFAMAVRLHEQGHFEWTDWAAELAHQIADEQTDHDEYYQHWLNTLEVMVVRSGLSTGGELSERRAAWRHAAATTPHGLPITLPED